MGTNHVRILLIEDNPGDARLIQEILQEAGAGRFDLVHAHQLATGLEYVTTHNLDLILLDLGLPDSQGFETFCKARAAAPGIPIVVLTGIADEALAMQSVSEGAQDYLVKGEYGNVLARTIRYAVERHRLEASIREGEKAFRLLVGNIPAIVFKGSADGSLEVFNARIEDLTGYPRKDFDTRRRKWQDLILPEDIPATKHLFIQALKGDKSYVREYRIRGRDGQVLWIQERSRIICDAQGRIDYISGIFFDITSQRQAEYDLEDTLTKLHQSLSGTVRALANVVETRDPYTAGHQKRVAQLSCAIAQEMGLGAKDIEGIRITGFLHDIGKIAVPTEILSKPVKLNKYEFALIKMHPKVGYTILQDIEFPWPVAHIVLQHHERLDGSGYPSGLKGDEILLEAKILAVADVVEAMSSYRPYRPALGLAAALEEISGKKGILYDSGAVTACVRLFTEQGFSFEEE